MGLRVNGTKAQEPLAAQLREAREAVDLTQAELAAHFSVSVRTIQLWEAGAADSARASHRRAIRHWVAFVNAEEAA
jgi:DNA-binding transcriptional regulator YiaG